MKRLLMVLGVAAQVALPPFASAAERTLAFKYENFGVPGTVVREDKIPELNLDLVTFSNGVKVNVRPSTIEPGRFQLRLVFPVNASHARDGLFMDENPRSVPPLAAIWSTRRIFLGDLARHTHAEVFALLTQHKIETEIRVDQGTPFVGLKGPAASLPFALRLVAAWLSDLQGTGQLGYFRGASDKELKFRLVPQDPERLSLWEAISVATGRDARIGRPEQFVPETVAWSNDGIYWMLSLANSPVDIGVVGDVKVAEVIADAATNVGALKREPFAAQGLPLAAPKKAAKVQSVSQAFGSDLSMSCVLWPLTGRETPAETAAVDVAAAILRDALLQATASLKKVIEPQAWIYRDPVQRDFAFVVMRNNFATPVASQLTDAIVRTAAKLADNGVPEAEFQRLREQVRQRRVADLANNQWWLDNVVWGAQAHPELTVEAKEHVTAVEALSLADVNSAAKVFSPGLVTGIILTGGQKPGGGKK